MKRNVNSRNVVKTWPISVLEMFGGVMGPKFSWLNVGSVYFKVAN